MIRQELSRNESSTIRVASDSYSQVCLELTRPRRHILEMSSFVKSSSVPFEIVDNDEDVVHPFKRHILPSLASLMMSVLAARGV
jgi:hypothetical protein